MMIPYFTKIFSALKSKAKKQNKIIVKSVDELYPAITDETNKPENELDYEEVLFIENIHMMLQLYFEHDVELSICSERYGITLTHANKLCGATKKIKTFIGKSHYNKPRMRQTNTETFKGAQRVKDSIPLPKKPIDQENYKRIVNKIWRLFISKDKELFWLINYHLKNSWSTDNKLGFKEVNNARRFLSFLDMIEVPEDKILFELHCSETENSINLVGYWGKKLSIEKEISIKTHGKNKFKGDKGRIAIGIESKTKSKTSSDSLRYIFHMLYLLKYAQLYGA